MAKSKIRMFLEIKHKKNKTELEEFYLKLKSYNFIADELSVSWSKEHLSIKDFTEKRKENYLKNINVINSMNKYETIEKEMKKTIIWDLNNVTFEQIFILEFENAKNNIKKDIVFMERLNYV